MKEFIQNLIKLKLLEKLNFGEILNIRNVLNLMIKRQELENEEDDHKKFFKIGVDIRILERRIKFLKEPKWSLF